MDLFEAFSISMRSQEVISFVGGGGKTSAIFRLAREMRSFGKKILVTTTTMMFVPDPASYDHIFIGKEAARENLQSIANGTVSVIGQEITPEAKLKGIRKEMADELAGRDMFDLILVEADGSKRRPIKAPDLHEPVVPRKTSKYIGVVGFDCYGKPLDAAWVHRPQLLAGLAGKRLGAVIDEEVFLKLAAAPEGLFKNCPDTSTKIILFNKVIHRENLIIAEKIGRSILDAGFGIKAVIIGAVLEEHPVHCVLTR